MVSETASAGACISTEIGWAKAIITIKSMAEITAKTTAAPPIKKPERIGSVIGGAADVYKRQANNRANPFRLFFAKIAGYEDRCV